MSLWVNRVIANVWQALHLPQIPNLYDLARDKPAQGKRRE